jgi:membrane protein DedA with SNARE-associated domain
MLKTKLLLLRYLSIKHSTNLTNLAQYNFNVIQLLQNLLHTFGYPAIIFFVMIESSGIPFPGETMLLLAAFYAAVYHDLALPLVITCAAIGAILGDNIGYSVGRTGGKALVEKYGHYIFLKPERITQTEHFFARHGDKTVFFGRFVAILRAWSAFLAGVNNMNWPKFLLYNAAGGILWAIIYGLIGYYAGKVFHDNFSAVEHLAGRTTLILAIFIILGALIAFLLYKKRKRHALTKHK